MKWRYASSLLVATGNTCMSLLHDMAGGWSLHIRMQHAPSNGQALDQELL